MKRRYVSLIARGFLLDCYKDTPWFKRTLKPNLIIALIDEQLF